MDVPKILLLLALYGVGYVQYKLIQRNKPDGFSGVSVSQAFYHSALFCVLSVALIVLSKDPFINVSALPLLVAIVTTWIWFFAPYIIRTIGTYPSGYIQKHPKRYSVQFEPRTLYTKFFEVAFQQPLFLFMLTTVLTSEMLWQRVLWFTLINAVLHLANILVLPKREALIFFGFSIPMGLVFGYLILEGYILITFSIHLWFYLIFSGRHWFRSNYGEI